MARPHPEEAAALAAAAHLPPVLAELLLARGVNDAREAHAFLNPDAIASARPFPDAGHERGRRPHPAGHRSASEPILLYGDYDVDGTTAVVLLKTAIEMLGGPALVRFHVPHRLREGYGLQSSVLEAAYADGVRLVITVDTGMRAFAEAETARRLGLDLIVTDHHLTSADDRVPDALAILNPNQSGCGYPEKSLCGAAIALKLAQALLEARDSARTREKTLPSFLKMAAIATIADAVPLRGENRTIAALGLRELRRPIGAGLRALFQAAALDPASKPLTGFDVAFRLAPRINAAGRMDVASQVIELFTTRDSARALDLATNLELLNRQRREAEAAALTAIETRLAEDAELAACRLLVIDGKGWHRGVIGILASRVVERTAKPAIVVSIEDRPRVPWPTAPAAPSTDSRCSKPSKPAPTLFTRFGGHAFAVGFAMPASSLPELKRRLAAPCRRAPRRSASPNICLRIHAELPLDRITPVLAGWLAKLEPLGHGNPEPVFAARGVRIMAPPRVMKDRHIALELRQENHGLAAGTATMRCVGWDWASRCMDLKLEPGSLIDVAYKIRNNDHPEYGGIETELAGIRAAEPQTN